MEKNGAFGLVRRRAILRWTCGNYGISVDEGVQTALRPKNRGFFASHNSVKGSTSIVSNKVHPTTAERRLIGTIQLLFHHFHRGSINSLLHCQSYLFGRASHSVSSCGYHSNYSFPAIVLLC